MLPPSTKPSLNENPPQQKAPYLYTRLSLSAVLIASFNTCLFLSEVFLTFALFLSVIHIILFYTHLLVWRSPHIITTLVCLFMSLT